MENAPAEFRELSKLNTADLKYMLQDTSYVDDWIAELPQARSLTSRLSEIRHENRSLAQKLLANQAKVASLKQGNRGRELIRLRENVEALLSERDAISAKRKAGHFGGVLA